MKHFVVKTLGCRVNQSETETICASLRKEGYSELEAETDPLEFETDAGSKTVCIINTCTVTEKASMQSRQAIRKAIRAYPRARIIVTGCYAQTQPDEIRQIKGVHDIIPQAEKGRVVSAILSNSTAPSRRTETVWSDTLSFAPEDNRGTRTRAVLKIQDGCNAYCTYCIVPRARGRSRSMPEAQVLSNLHGFQRAGYNEVVLSGIHLGNYGLDLNPKTSLIALLRQIDSLGIINRIRLSSIEPAELSDEIVTLVAGSNRFCRHFHIPLQSGDNAVLKKMGRTYSRSFFADLVHGIHDKIPDAAIGMDVLVGFPGETDSAFKSTFDLVESLPVTYLHVFPFSPRKKTPAFNMPNKVPQQSIKSRAAQIRALGVKKRRVFYDSLVGGKTEVLLEGAVGNSPGTFKGRTSNYVPVFLDNYSGEGNRFVSVKIEKRIGDRGVLASPI